MFLNRVYFLFLAKYCSNFFETFLLQLLVTMRKSTSSFGGSSSGSTNYVSDDCEYQNSAYKGAMAGATTALESVAGVVCGAASVTPACVATSAFASIGSMFSDTLDSQNLCTDYTMLALSDISDKISEMQVKLSEIATAISESTLISLYGDEIISLASASDLYVRCKDSSGCGNLNLDLENCQMWLRLVSSINEAHKQAYFLLVKQNLLLHTGALYYERSAI